MSTKHMLFSKLRSLIQKNNAWRRERVERQPVMELMEPRALLSGLETGVAPAIPSHHAGAVLVIPITESPPLHVVYQTNHAGGAIGLAQSTTLDTPPTVQEGHAKTIDLTVADDSSGSDGDDGGGSDGDGGDGDGSGDDDDGGDENDDENDPDSSS
jgi:hypothetical protein